MGIRERQSRERDTVRRKILNAARTLFLNEGYANVSMRKIAEQIEYSPGAIYSYFTSKEDIFFALAEEGLQFVRAHCVGGLARELAARAGARGAVALLHVQQGTAGIFFPDLRRQRRAAHQPRLGALQLDARAAPRDRARHSAVHRRGDVSRRGIARRDLQDSVDGGVRRRRLSPEPSSGARAKTAMRSRTICSTRRWPACGMASSFTSGAASDTREPLEAEKRRDR